MAQVIGYPQGGALLSGTNESAAPLPVGYNKLPEFDGVGAAAVPVMATRGPGGGVELTAGGESISSLTDQPLPSAYRRRPGGKSFIWKHPATSTDHKDALLMYAPVGGGYYDVTVINRIAGTAVYQVSKRFFGVAGSFVHHSAGSGVTKTGTWVVSAATYAPAGSTLQSSTAGDSIEYVTAGHSLVMRTITTTNGGYGVVAIDGDWTAANRLPVFTEADHASGLCRAADIGRRYVVSYGVDAFPDVHIPLAEGLSDTAHTVRIEVCGTKPAGSSAARVYVGGIVGGSASDTTSDLVVGTRCVGYLETVVDRRDGASASIYTPEVEKALTAGTYEFLGETHDAETLVSLSIWVDGTDRSAMAANEMYGGEVIAVDRVTTIANTDATDTPVCRKKVRYTVSGMQDCPLTIRWQAEWLVDKRVRYGYPMMMPLCRADTTSVSPKQDRWNIGWIGGRKLPDGSFGTNDNAQKGNYAALYVVAGSTYHNRRSFAALMDGGASVGYWASGAPDLVFLQDRADGYDKFYVSRSTSKSPEFFTAGDKIGGTVGFGVVPF